MSDKTLRAMYAGMVQARMQVSRSKDRVAKAAYGDVACFAAALVGLRTGDLAFECREGRPLEVAGKAGSLPRIAHGVGRLYAAAGAAMTFPHGSERVAMAFFEGHEVGGAAWAEGLRLAAGLPLVLVVVPRWKGKDAGDLCAESREAGVPGIAVDAGDAIALYRVAQESLVRARTGGGAALMEGVWFRLEGERLGRGPDPVETLGVYLLRRGAASETWLQRVGSHGAARRGMGVDASA